MKKNSSIFLLGALFAIHYSLLSLTGCASSKSQLKVGETAEGEVVEAEGLAAIVDDLLGVKRAALNDAKKDAVEKVIGVLISAKTIVDKAVTIQQNILAKTDGYVKKYEILKEGKEEDGIYHCHIRALVSFKEVKDDLQSSDILKEPAVGNPRVAILIDELIEAEGGGEGTSSTACSDALAQGLIDQGYKVVDRSEMAAIRVAEATRELLAGNTDKALKPIVQKLDAEVVVVGKVRTKLLTASGLGGLISYRGSFSGKAIRAQTGQILAAVTSQGSGLDAVSDAAAEKSLVSMGKAASKELGERAKIELAKRSSVLVTVRGVDLNSLGAVKNAITLIPGVKDIYTRSFASGVAEMDINVMTATAQTIGDVLSKDASLKLQISNMTADSLEAQVQ